MNFIEAHLTHEEYKQLVEETYGEYIPHIQHTVVLCKEGENIVAVFNYIQTGVAVIFLHNTWYSKDYQKKIKKLHHWLGFCEYIKGLGYKYIVGAIYAQNTPALQWALKTGCLINGVRQGSDKSMIVEIVKEL